MTLSRRTFLTTALGATLYGAVRGRSLLALTSSAPHVFWVQVHAQGGWDQMLFCDPKFGPRQDQNGGFHDLKQLSQVAQIPYVDAYAANQPGVKPVGAFFQEFGTRLLVLNGIDTATNNHDVGTRYCMSGSVLEGFPIFAAQVAGVLGQGQVMPLVDISGYDEAGGLVAPVRLDYVGVPKVAMLQDPGKPSPGQWLNNTSTVTAKHLLDPDLRTTVRQAALDRLARQQAAVTLPQHQHAMAAWQSALLATPGLADLKIPQVGSDAVANVKALATMGIEAFKAGHATSMTVAAGGPNLDSHGITDADHLTELGIVFDVVRHIANTADAAGVPCVVVMSSDFGRTPVRETTGSGHWPVASLMLLQNNAALPLKLLPAGQVIGGTTGTAQGPNDLKTVLRARKLHPVTHALDDAAGITLTPAHIYRTLRQIAGIADAPALAPYAIHIDGDDLQLG